MKINTKVLKQAIQDCDTHTNSCLPVLNSYYFKDGCIEQNNLEYRVKKHLCDFNEHFVINKDVLRKCVGNLDGDIEITVVDDEKIKLENDGISYTLKTLQEKDYPIGADVDSGFECEIPIELIRECFVFASTDTSRVILNSVCLDFENGNAVATDSFKMLINPIDVSGDTQVILPYSAVKKLISLKEQTAKFLIGENTVKIVLGSIEIISRLIDGTYPPYLQLLPKEFETNALISRDRLLKIAQKIQALPQSFVIPIKLEFDGKLSISAYCREVGELNAELECVCNGKASVSFNPGYLIDILEICPETVSVEISQTRTNLFETKNGRALLMPIRTDN
jgi:DNA polymerase-3 subunit beta